MTGLDPIEVLAVEFRMVRIAHGLTDTVTPSETDRNDARRALGALYVRGYRVARIEPAGLWEDPRFEGPYNEDESRPDDAYELFSVTDEWSPVGSSAADAPATPSPAGTPETDQ